MALLFSLTIGSLITCGVYLLLRARTFPVVLGLTLVSYAVNLFLFLSGRLTPDSAPLVIPEIVGPIQDLRGDKLVSVLVHDPQFHLGEKAAGHSPDPQVTATASGTGRITCR